MGVLCSGCCQADNRLSAFAQAGCGCPPTVLPENTEAGTHDQSADHHSRQERRLPDLDDIHESGWRTLALC